MGGHTKLKPEKEFRAYRRNLPHIELTGSIYFITFRTTREFELSDRAKEIVLESIKFHDSKKYKLCACVVMDTHVHVILQPLEAQAGTPVPPSNSVPPSNNANHKLTRIDSAFYSLSEIMHSIKSYSANRIQKLLHWKGGSVWLDENYDRIVRNEKEFEETFNYIIHNPVKAGLVEKPEDYKWFYYEGSE